MTVAYEDYRKNKIESGLLYQDFIVDLLLKTIGLPVNQYASRAYQCRVGESRTGVEIKHDEQFHKTGNLWIEVAEKARPRSGDYVPSGICRDDNSWLYVIGDYDTVFVFPKNILLALRGTKCCDIRENRTKTSKGYLLCRDAAFKYAAYKLTPNAGVTIAKYIGDLETLGRVLHAAAQSDPSQTSLLDLLA